MLSATDAFSPALERTKFMLQPFSLGLWLKLGLISVLAECGFQVVFPPFGGGPGSHSHDTTSGISAVTGGLTHLFLIGLIAAALIGIVVVLALFYVGSRMQLVLMDLVATRTTQVAPAWRRQGPKTWRWIGLKLLFFFAVVLVAAVILAYPIFILVRTLSHNNAGAIGGIFLFIAAGFFFIFLIVLAVWLLRDFVLPFIVFEDAPIPDALSRAAELIRREPGAVLLYLFLKFLITMGGAIAAELCLVLCALIAAIPLGLIAGILWFALHNSGPIATLLMYTGFGLLGFIFVACLLVAGICVAAAVLIFYQAYALYFLGGRIPTLGNLLEPPPAYYAAPTPPPEPQPPLGDIAPA
jgi:hypothetical protein